MRMNHQLLVTGKVQIAVGLSFTVLRADVHLAHIVQQTAEQRQAHRGVVSTSCSHQGPVQSHCGHSMGVVFRPRGLRGCEQELGYGVQSQPFDQGAQTLGMGLQQREQRRAAAQQLLERKRQARGADAIFRHQTGFQRLTQLTVQQLALQRGGHGLVASPKLYAGNVVDVGGGNDPAGFARLQNGGQSVGVGFTESTSVRGGRWRHRVSPRNVMADYEPCTPKSTTLVCHGLGDNA